MDRDELQRRAFDLGIRVLHLVDALPMPRSANVVATQLAKSGTSIGANDRAARRARSRKEFRSKLSIVVEEADETEHWLQVVAAAGMIESTRMSEPRSEATELLKIFSRMRKTAYES